MEDSSNAASETFFTRGRIRTTEWILLGLICFILLFLQIVLFQNAGAFWRDETNSVQVANEPFSEIWSPPPVDTSPPLYPSLVRLWIISGLGGTDGGIRFLGTLITLGIVASVAICSYILTGDVPLIAAALAATNASIFYYGSIIRPYGLSALLIVLCFAAFYRMVRSPSRLNVMAASIIAFPAVHFNYHNCYLLAAIGVAGVIVCAIKRQWKLSLLIFAICSAALLSLLIYLPFISMHSYIEQNRDFSYPISNGLEAMAASFTMLNIAPCTYWAAAGLFGLIVLPFLHRGTVEFESNARLPAMYLFNLIVIIAGALGGIIFLYASRHQPNFWHFMPFVALAAAIIELGFHTSKRKYWLPAFKMLFALAIIGAGIMPMWRIAHIRRTNMDLVCNTLARDAGAEDFIIVNPFWLSPGFNYYYHGRADWNILPLIQTDRDARLMPSKYVQEVMTRQEAIKPTLEKITNTLKAGHSVWFVGGITLPQSNAELEPELPPAPQSKHGWNCMPYLRVWNMHVGRYLQQHAEFVGRYPKQAGQSISDIEIVITMTFKGWKDSK